MEVGSILRVIVALPTLTLTITATTVHCGVRDVRKPLEGHLVGMRIVEMSEIERTHLTKYLNKMH